MHAVQYVVSSVRIQSACCAGELSISSKALEALEQVLQLRQLWQQQVATIQDAVACLNLLESRTDELCLQYDIR